MCLAYALEVLHSDDATDAELSAAIEVVTSWEGDVLVFAAA